MPLQSLYINEENIIKLKKEINMSQLVNKLLSQYFLIGLSELQKLEAVEPRYQQLKEEFENLKKVRDELDNKLSQELFESRHNADEMEKISTFLLDFGDNIEKQEEYRKGIKSGKWKGTVQFAKIKIAEQEANEVFKEISKKDDETH